MVGMQDMLRKLDSMEEGSILELEKGTIVVLEGGETMEVKDTSTLVKMPGGVIKELESGTMMRRVPLAFRTPLQADVSRLGQA